jgi:hypothetical protein
LRLPAVVKYTSLTTLFLQQGILLCKRQTNSLKTNLNPFLPMKKDLDTILVELSYFNGTEGYHSYKIPTKQEYFLTDGVSYLCKTCECFWLVDYLISLQNHSLIKDQQFQVWRLYIVDNKWNITCEDGNKKILYHSQIDFSDFPLNGITVWLIDGIILLPSEY